MSSPSSIGWLLSVIAWLAIYWIIALAIERLRKCPVCKRAAANVPQGKSPRMARQGTIRLAREKCEDTWSMRREVLRDLYSTSWQELPVERC
ncbi:DUF4113 domain-containing protein [Pseudomonas sp. NPDC077382]